MEQRNVCEGRKERLRKEREVMSGCRERERSKLYRK